jgi:hypothetical protein
MLFYRTSKLTSQQIHLILASALRILGLCHNIANVEANFRHETDEEFENTEMFAEPDEVSVNRNPHIYYNQ